MSSPSMNNLNAMPNPSQAGPQGQDVQALKRRICALELENAQMHSKVCKKPLQTLSREGRAVRRLVALSEPIADMIAEHDRRRLRLAEVGVSMAMIQSESTPDQERTHNNFKKLVSWCPSVSKLLEDGEFDLYACRELQAGADGARGDDASMLKAEVVLWITADTNHDRIGVDQLSRLSPRDKEWRGLNHELTGRLLCPVDYNWDDLSVRTCIREYHHDFRVTAYSWPLFLYEGNRYDPSSPSRGLFRSELLVKGFKCIFTSPGSARRHDGNDQALRSKGPRARSNVAQLLRMKTVQPRAIAYVAAQIRFSLSSASSWAVVDEDFNYDTFYSHIVDYFETPDSPDKSAEINTLVVWWNRIIFGRCNVNDYRPLRPETLSVARSRK